MKLINFIYTTSSRLLHQIQSCFARLKELYKKTSNPWEPQYTTIKNLGSGGNACVIAVADNKGNQYALKPLDKEYLSRRDKRERFLREVNVMKNTLSDLSGVIPIIDSCKKGYWYVMPIAKKSMDVVKEMNMNLDQRIEAFLTISDTLKIIHSRKISHRDIKPANILYYNEHFCFCDFGLCHIENSKLTQKRDNIGAKFTIAPEMKRDSKKSDPYKADVYSMGKTLWMYLTENEDAFEGTYNPLEKGIGLHFLERYKKAYIAEIEFLLEKATKDNPEERPTIDEFHCILSKWLIASKNKDEEAIQKSEFKIIKHYLNPSIDINSLTITTPEDIVKALNHFRLAPTLNHMLYPKGGGLDFDSAEMAKENGCIALRSDFGTIEILKPKQFVFESFDDYKWFYFLLEADKLTPILTKQDVLSEELLEDTPGHYCDDYDFVYGVYDYDSGKKLPPEARKIKRFCRGTFLIVPKFGYYNQQPSTYDARHNNCTPEEFKAHMQKMKKIADEGKKRGYTFAQIVHVLNQIPSPFSQPDNSNLSHKSDKTVPVPESFISDMIGNLDVSCILSKINDKTSPATFALYITPAVTTKNFASIIICDHDDETQCYLCKDGKIRNTSWKDDQVLKLHDRCITNSLIEEVETAINNAYHSAGFENKGFQSTVCKMTMRRTGKPTHLFTQKEIKVLMKNADDRLNNTLVIDEFGHAQVIPGYFDKHTYPVSQETWCSRNNYVGKYSSLPDLDQSYEYMLEGWLDYLMNDVTTYVDHRSEDLKIPELINKIKMYY